MALPQRFELVVTPGAVAASALAGSSGGLEMSGAASSSAATVQALLPQVEAAMASANLAVGSCSAMATTDVTNWNGVYTAWQTYDQQVNDALNINFFNPFSLFLSSTWQGLGAGSWDDVMAKLTGYQTTAQQWQSQVHQACPNYVPPPPPTSPQTPAVPAGQPTGSWLCRTLGWGCGGSSSDDGSDWSGTLKWVAIAAVVCVGAWYLGPLIYTVAGVGAGAIRKRVAGKDEYEPVTMYPRFGNMPIGDAPTALDPLQFGDVDKSEVLSLVGGK